MTPKESKFCEFYAQNGGNAREAARQAGYSEQYIAKRSYQLVSKPHIVAEVNRIRGRVNQIVERNAADVVNQLSKLAFSQVIDFIKPDPEKPGNWISKAPEELTDDQRAAVATVRVVETKHKETNAVTGYSYLYTLHDQMMALIQMGRHFGIFDDKLKLISSAANRFQHLSPEQLAGLRTSIVKYMERATAVNGEASDEAQKMLSDDSGHRGSGQGH